MVSAHLVLWELIRPWEAKVLVNLVRWVTFKIQQNRLLVSGVPQERTKAPLENLLVQTVRSEHSNRTVVRTYVPIALLDGVLLKQDLQLALFARSASTLLKVSARIVRQDTSRRLQEVLRVLYVLTDPSNLCLDKILVLCALRVKLQIKLTMNVQLVPRDRMLLPEYANSVL